MSSPEVFLTQNMVDMAFFVIFGLIGVNYFFMFVYLGLLLKDKLSKGLVD